MRDVKLGHRSAAYTVAMGSRKFAVQAQARGQMLWDRAEAAKIQSNVRRERAHQAWDRAHQLCVMPIRRAGVPASLPASAC